MQTRTDHGATWEQSLRARFHRSESRSLGDVIPSLRVLIRSSDKDPASDYQKDKNLPVQLDALIAVLPTGMGGRRLNLRAPVFMRQSGHSRCNLPTSILAVPL